MSEFQGKREVPKVGRLSDPLFKSITWTNATKRLNYDEINILISLILHDRTKSRFKCVSTRKGIKKENNMKSGKGIVNTAIGLALLGVTIFVVGFAFQKGKDRAES